MDRKTQETKKNQNFMNIYLVETYKSKGLQQFHLDFGCVNFFSKAFNS